MSEVEQAAAFGNLVMSSLRKSDQGAVAVEKIQCRRCGQFQIIVHAFIEATNCPKCQNSMATRSPNWPAGQEPRAIDWEEAVLEVGAYAPELARTVYDLALKQAANRCP